MTLSQEQDVPTIRIDEEVYEWLKAQAEPFEDTPNSVLRRIASMDTVETAPTQSRSAPEFTGKRSVTGEGLRQTWRIPVRQARFHKDGTFFERPVRFPAALCDLRGYVQFATEKDLTTEPRVKVGLKKVNVQTGISSLRGYKLAPVR